MVNQNKSELEIQRLQEEYARRKADVSLSDKYSADDPTQRFILSQRHRAIKKIMDRHLPAGLSKLSILEIGCGSGGVLKLMAGLGAEPTQLVGLDLLQDRLIMAHQQLVTSSFICGNGQHLPFTSNSFDLLLQFTAFSSILDSELKRDMAAEMLRVLMPGGSIIWYDFTWNPANAQTKGIGLREIMYLFPYCELTSTRVTLAPPLIRFLLPRFPGFVDWLSSMRLFNSHLLVLIKKKLD